MLTRVKTATLEGVKGNVVTVETDIRRGMPKFIVVGLAGTTIRESYDRIRPAIINSGFEFPNERITVNLMPAGKPKDGSHFDLPIAVGIIMGARNFDTMDDMAFMGELSLDGKINRIKGALPLAMSLRSDGIRNIIVPVGNAEEVAILKDVNVYPADSLREVINHIEKIKYINVYNSRIEKQTQMWEIDFSQVVGQEMAKRAVMTAAAGTHGVLLMGSAGCGKTMLAKRIPTILPELTYEEKLEITGIYSVAGLLTEEEQIIENRPFRNPHNSISVVNMIGGGRKPEPGELSLAHNGVIFLDEFGEFNPAVIDAMRQPVEEGVVRITRSFEEMIFPAQVLVVAAANPCKCGNLWDEKKRCTCTARQIESYTRKLRGPFSDRIDMHIKMTPVDKKLLDSQDWNISNMSSAEMKESVIRARKVQKRRYDGTIYKNNGCLDEKGIKEFCILDNECRTMLNEAYEKYGLSLRAYNKVIKIARTLADMEESENIQICHIAEALLYRVDDERK